MISGRDDAHTQHLVQRVNAVAFCPSPSTQISCSTLSLVRLRFHADSTQSVGTSASTSLAAATTSGRLHRLAQIAEVQSKRLYEHPTAFFFSDSGRDELNSFQRAW